MERSVARKDWEDRIADHSTTRLSDREWCERTEVTGHQLRYWRRRLQKKPEGALWAAVQIVPEEASGNAPITICLGSARIEVRADFDQSLLSDVLRVAAASC